MRPFQHSEGTPYSATHLSVSSTSVLVIMAEHQVLLPDRLSEKVFFPEKLSEFILKHLRVQDKYFSEKGQHGKEEIRMMSKIPFHKKTQLITASLISISAEYF